MRRLTPPPDGEPQLHRWNAPTPTGNAPAADAARVCTRGRGWRVVKKARGERGGHRRRGVCVALTRHDVTLRVPRAGAPRAAPAHSNTHQQQQQHMHGARHVGRSARGVCASARDGRRVLAEGGWVGRTRGAGSRHGGRRRGRGLCEYVVEMQREVCRALQPSREGGGGPAEGHFSGARVRLGHGRGNRRRGQQPASRPTPLATTVTASRHPGCHWALAAARPPPPPPPAGARLAPLAVATGTRARQGTPHHGKLRAKVPHQAATPRGPGTHARGPSAQSAPDRRPPARRDSRSVARSVPTPPAPRPRLAPPLSVVGRSSPSTALRPSTAGRPLRLPAPRSSQARARALEPPRRLCVWHRVRRRA